MKRKKPKEPTLSTRQRQAMTLDWQGKTFYEIGEAMGISGPSARAYVYGGCRVFNIDRSQIGDVLFPVKVRIPRNWKPEPLPVTMWDPMFS